MSWKDLSMKDRASYIKLGIDTGITDLDTIKEVYNKYEDGGGLRDKALNRANYVASNYDKAQDFDMNPFVYTIRKFLKDHFDKGGLSNCTLSATQWVDPNNSYMSAKNIEGHSNTGYKEISKDAAVPGDLLISKNPNRGSYHTMMITGFDKNQNPILSYSRGGHDTKNNLVTGRGLLDYHAADNSQGGYHTEDHYFRYNYPDETTLPEVVITAPRKKEFKIGGPLKKSYKDFSTRLSKAWNNQDLSKDDYNYQKYYNDNPEKAYRQLEAIERGSKAHFPDEGKSGTYKTPNHPTYPDLGINSWLDNDRVFNMSQRQAHGDTDRVLDYLGSDIDYNNGSTRAMYNGAYQLPSITVTPKGNHTDLIPNELGTGWMYKGRAGRYNDFDYNYVNNYPSNKKSLGGNLFKDGGKKATRYKSSSNIRKQISTWEGATMKTNTPFDEMDTMFNQVLPAGALEKLSQGQLDGLYSFAYNVGTGRFKTRTVPTLVKYLQGNATIEDVKQTMWATGDKKYRGLANRRKKEKAMLGSYTPVSSGPLSSTTPMMINQFPPSEEIKIPQLQFSEAFNNPSPVALEPSSLYDSNLEDTNFSEPNNSLTDILGILQMIRSPRKVNIYT